MADLTLAAGGDTATEPDSEAANASGATSRVLPWRRTLVLAAAAFLFLAVGSLRIAHGDASTAIFVFYLLPIALLAAEFGLRGGVLGAVAACVFTGAWALVLEPDLAAGDLLLRCALLMVVGPCFGLVGDRLAQAASDLALIHI